VQGRLPHVVVTYRIHQALHLTDMSVDPLKALEQQLAEERASMLGDAGRKVEATLAALDHTADSVDEAATAVWYYMILREAAGMYDHEEAFAIYGVPGRVLARVGVIRKPTG